MVIYFRVLRLPALEHNLIIHTNSDYVNFILKYKKSNNRKSSYVYENIMSDVTKFTEVEMQEIAIVQSKYQQKIKKFYKIFVIDYYYKLCMVHSDMCNS